MPATPAWLAAVEALLERGARASPQAAALLQRLDRTALRVDIVGMTSIRASVAGGRLALVAANAPLDTAAQVPAPRDDAVIAGSPVALWSLARGSGGGTGRGSARSPMPATAPAARASVSGDAEIANLYRQLIAAARPDFEDELSRIVGDLPARRLAQFAKHTMAWARKARRTAGENLAEYLQEESRDLVNACELDEFLQGVDAAREALDRIEARLARLEQRAKGVG